MLLQRRALVAMAAAVGATLVTPFRGSAQEAATAASLTETTPQTGYAPVNGLEMYYEIHGSGEPLVLLHSSFYTIDSWGPFLASLAETHQVIAMEFQGHGHTADIDRPF